MRQTSTGRLRAASYRGVEQRIQIQGAAFNYISDICDPTDLHNNSSFASSKPLWEIIGGRSSATPALM